MFILVESIRAALNSINAHRFRAFLTSLGIIVGVASIIALVCVIQGLSGSVTRLFQGLGTNNLAITSFTSNEKQLSGQFARLNPEDLNLIREKVGGISAITPVLISVANASSMSALSYSSKKGYSRVLGTTYTYQKLSQMVPVHGRFLTDSDNRTRRRVAVVGEEVRQKMGMPANPVGEYIEINGEWVKIVGLMEPKGDAFGVSQDDYVLLPYDTMQSLIGNQNQSDIQILLTVEDLTAAGEIRQRITRLLRASHKLEDNQEDDFKIQSPEQLLSSFSDFINAITYFTIGMVSISLLVGGIGIMNIMLVSVNERTREIGICKAIGAKRHHILLQFLLEALILCLLGGLIGILLGYGIGTAAAHAMNFPLSGVPAWAIGLAFGFVSVVGVVFGMLPAAKAANLDPIVALRYE
ncbi:ABC transporter permease [Tahibacter harae]|uniref:ABC transporter permease n=1 Tax=Tahibacter harae TaxID=2963937 RepID=A0ABT1QT26_9GAMM|nr:ABC transporter permease [Tahibacter harae]MCQ4165445.1 ABC transporter permease [Tahibacter harae]